MTTGAVVWAVLGGAWVVWLLAAAAVPVLPGPLRVARGLVGSWPGRAISLAAWAEIGWHVFCQRP